MIAQPAGPCDMRDGCGAAAGEPCEPGCPSLAYDPEPITSGQPITVTLSAEAAAVLAGVVAPESEGIYPAGIYSGEWPELQRIFHIGLFREWSAGCGPYDPDDDNFVGYNPHAGE